MEQNTALKGSTVCQVLTFRLAEEVYGVDIMSVREVLDFSSVTKVPHTPDFMVGVINLRGNVVPVVDLKKKFRMGATERSVNTCIIIVEVQIDGESTILGALADSVQEVVEFEDNVIEDAPKIGTQLNTAFIAGMAKRESGFVIILNVNAVFSMGELSVISQTQQLPAEENHE
ncbi:chemotaxis protein CheW [Seleniivibrio sp.]|uniref:chemotaxis protein CheW n=1 Tax=Seleniivibrio sp. TaxID=2898801 RepID=UPI0025E88ABD|nr:chemotaxis protein CheW [Seleniivibrio sp.]MCD8554477.1 chemotaxis protein CheW [Seleniivibrio sp.]